MRAALFLWVFAGGLGLLARPAWAVEIVSEGGPSACQEVFLKKSLPLFKDPGVFLSTGVTESEWQSGQLLLEVLEESPLITKLEPGSVQWMLLGKPKAFPNMVFQGVYRYLRGEPLVGPLKSVKIIPVKLCSGRYEAYRDTLGFVVEEDLNEATKSQEQEGLPPSVYPNPVPVYLP